MLYTPLESTAAVIRSFLLSVSSHPFGVKNFVKIRVDRPIVPLNILIKIIIFLQIHVNGEFFPKKKVFSIFWARGDGVWEIFLVIKFFLGTPNWVSWKFWKSEIKGISLYLSGNNPSLKIFYSSMFCN